MISRALLLSALVSLGLALGPRPVHSLSLDVSDNAVLRTAAGKLARETAPRVAAWLRRQADVVDVAVTPDQQEIDVRFQDGERGAVLPRSIATRTIAVRSPLTSFRPMARVAAPGARAVVMEPFKDELSLPSDAGDLEAGVLRSAGFQVDELSNSQVTVSSMMNLASYSIVYIVTHSHSETGGDGIIATGEIVNDDPALAPLLQNGSLIKVAVSGDQKDVFYGLQSAFVKNYLGTFPASSMMFVNGCDLINAPSFILALQSKGLSSLVSWDNEATNLDNYLNGRAFFNLMGQGMSINGTLQAMQAAGYGKSTVDGKTATMKVVGNGSLTLQQALSAPANTPIPAATHTATAVPATSTPQPTLTPTPLLPLALAVSLKPKVRPGEKQVVQITSMPNTILHIRVSFPSGDGRTETTATDSSGHARFTFVQHASRVTYQHVFATVTIRASHDGAAPSQTTERYRILWGPIDASVLPRQQAVGGRVTVWVHTASHTAVTVVLHFPSGDESKLQDLTGGDGWAHLPYKVGRYLKKPNNHMVQVAATATVAGKTYTARTTFSIT